MHILGGGVNSRNKVYDSFNLDKELTKVNPVKALTSGLFTTADIGKTVYLSNSEVDNQEWQIADVNHDNTSGTVDLFPKYILCAASHDNRYYSKSSLRTSLNTTVSGFTAEIQNAMKVQVFTCNGETLYDKVKCPSMYELGCGLQAEYVFEDGTFYPLFGQPQNDKNPLAGREYNPRRSMSGYYWTRTPHCSTGAIDEYYAVGESSYTWFNMFQTNWYVVFGCVGIIRF